MRIVFLGSGQFGVPCLDALRRSRHELVFVGTQPAKAAGRGRRCCPTPVAEWAERQGVPYLAAADINQGEPRAMIGAHRPDLIVVVAFGQKVGPEVIGLAPQAAINVHASLLPRWRGAAPINWALLAGDRTTGVTVITLAERIDAGLMLGAGALAIGATETAGELHDRLAEAAAPLLLRVLDEIETGTATYTPQDESQVTRAYKLCKRDGYLDFKAPASELDRRIRGLWPWPGATALYESRETGKTLRVSLAACAVETGGPRGDLRPGTLNETLHVVCGEGALRILRLQPAGKPLMDFAAFVNGRHTRPGDRFLSLNSDAGA